MILNIVDAREKNVYDLSGTARAMMEMKRKGKERGGLMSKVKMKSMMNAVGTTGQG